MSLPDLIEIKPLEKLVRAEITVPGSKSITNRALILAALADGEVTLHGALWSEDTQVMVDCLQKLGFKITVVPDEREFCNRTITVQGLGGKIPNGGTPAKPLELFVRNAGTAARFLSAFVCLGDGVYRLSGVPRMHERPQAELFKALRELGYRVDSENDKLPAAIHGIGPLNAECVVSIEDSSQFASALLLCAHAAKWTVNVQGMNTEESSYVLMTRRMVEDFPKRGGNFIVEPDASSGSYFWGAAWILHQMDWDKLIRLNIGRDMTTIKLPNVNRVEVKNWPKSGLQLDADFTIFYNPEGSSPVPKISRQDDLADSIMTAVVLAPFAITSEGYMTFSDLGRLRLQECERVEALRNELTRCGAIVFERGETLTVNAGELHGAEIETYNDHRMAMCFAILGLKVPGIKIKNPSCVKKTFPNFFQKLAAPPPSGLGATIMDARTQKPLNDDELFAD